LSEVFFITQPVPELAPHRTQACADSKRDSKMTKARPQILLKIGQVARQQKLLLIFRNQRKVDWNFDFEIPATQNCGHPTLMVLNYDWSSLGCLFSILVWDRIFFL
jgi:hypothetical protein